MLHHKPYEIKYLEEDVADDAPDERAALRELGVYPVGHVLQVVPLPEVFGIEQQQHLPYEAGVDHALLRIHVDGVVRDLQWLTKVDVPYKFEMQARLQVRTQRSSVCASEFKGGTILTTKTSNDKTYGYQTESDGRERVGNPPDGEGVHTRGPSVSTAGP